MSNHDNWWQQNQRVDRTPRQDGGWSTSPAPPDPEELMQAIEAEYEAEYEDEFGA